MTTLLKTSQELGIKCDCKIEDSEREQHSLDKWITDPLREAVTLRNSYFIKTFLNAGFVFRPSPIYQHDVIYQLLRWSFLHDAHQVQACLELIIQSGYTNVYNDDSKIEATKKVIKSLLEYEYDIEKEDIISEIVDSLVTLGVFDLKVIEDILQLNSCITSLGFGNYRNHNETFLFKKLIRYYLPTNKMYLFDREQSITTMEYFILRNNIEAIRLLLDANMPTDIGINKIRTYHPSGEYSVTKVFPYNPLFTTVFYILEPRVSALTLAILRCPDLVIPILESGCKAISDCTCTWQTPEYIEQYLTDKEIGKLHGCLSCDRSLAQDCLGPDYEHVKQYLSAIPVEPVSLLIQCRGCILEYLSENGFLTKTSIQSLGLPLKLQGYLVT